MSVTAHADLSKLSIKRDYGTPQEAPGGKNRVVVYLVAIVAVLAALWFFFGRSFSSPTEVQTTTVSLMYPSQANALLTASGYVVAQHKAAIASKATGRLEALNVEEGDVVKAGQVIGRIEHADVEANLEQTRASLEQAKAEYEDAEHVYKSNKSLAASKLISSTEFGQIQARWKKASAGVRAAKANVNALQVQLENTYIRAPFDGTILNKNAEVGEIVAPFAASASSRGNVVTIADMKSMEVEADVSESNIARVRVGNPCEIVLDAVPDTRYRGIVHKIIPTADRAKATVMTKIRFTEFDSRVLPEMSAKIMFLSDASSLNTPADAKPILTARREGIVQRDGKNVAFIVRGESVALVPVTTGQIMGDVVEITSGLSANDTIVLSPGESLKDGMKVSVKK